MAKRKIKKYQVAGDTLFAASQAVSNGYSSNGPNMPFDWNMIQNQDPAQLLQQPQQQGQGTNPFNMSGTTNDLLHNPFMINTAISTIGNSFINARQEKIQRNKMYDAMREHTFYNYNEDGKNDQKAYYQVGGVNHFQVGGQYELHPDEIEQMKAQGYEFDEDESAQEHSQESPADERNEAELEQGEVYQNTQGGISKIGEEGNTHEEGGEVVNDAQRILEDTSDKRKDFASKMLKLDPAEIERLTGLKSNRSLSHSKAFEKASEFHNKRAKSLEKVIKRNIEYTPNNQYAQNSLILNAQNMEDIPTAGNIFDNLFNHQEELKAKYNIQNEKEGV